MSRCGRNAVVWEVGNGAGDQRGLMQVSAEDRMDLGKVGEYA